MDTGLTGLVVQCRTLEAEAEAGRLLMEPDIGTALQGHAQRMLADLDRLVGAAGQLAHLSGFGTLATADALRRKFEGKADGDASAAQRLRESTEVVTLLASTYEKAIRAIEDIDRSNSRRLTDTDPGSP